MTIRNLQRKNLIKRQKYYYSDSLQNIWDTQARTFRFQLQENGIKDIDKLPQILKACQAKPISFYQNQEHPYSSIDVWMDEYGGTISAKFGEYRLEQQKDPNFKSDLFMTFTFQQILSLSNKIIYCDQYFILLGFDSLIRAFDIHSLKRISPLMAGLKPLQLLIQEQKLENDLLFDPSSDVSNSSGILGSIPVTKYFRQYYQQLTNNSFPQ